MDNNLDYHFYKDDETGTLMQMDLATGEVVPANVDTTIVTRRKYTPTIASRICQLVREGKPISKIGLMDEFPNPAVIYQWARKYPDFAEALKNAREDRAEYFHDKVIETAEAIQEKDDVPVAKEQIAAYKWAAEKGNPNRYGKSQEASSGSVTIIVDTGIPDKEESCQIEDVITMPSETYSSKVSSSAEDSGEEPQSIWESQEEPCTTGLSDTLNADSTTLGEAGDQENESDKED